MLALNGPTGIVVSAWQVLFIPLQRHSQRALCISARVENQRQLVLVKEARKLRISRNTLHVGQAQPVGIGAPYCSVNRLILPRISLACCRGTSGLAVDRTETLGQSPPSGSVPKEATFSTACESHHALPDWPIEGVWKKSLNHRSAAQIKLEQRIGGMAGQKLAGLALPVDATANKRTLANSRITKDQEVIIVE